MSDQTWYYMDKAGAQHGPINTPQLQALVTKSEITEGTQVRKEKHSEQWTPAAQIAGLFPQPSAPALRHSPHIAITPNLAATTPMLPSTPTTQPVRGVPIPTTTQQQTPYQSPSSNPELGLVKAISSSKSSNYKLWILLLILVIPLLLLGLRLLSK